MNNEVQLKKLQVLLDVSVECFKFDKKWYGNLSFFKSLDKRDDLEKNNKQFNSEHTQINDLLSNTTMIRKELGELNKNLKKGDLVYFIYDDDKHIPTIQEGMIRSKGKNGIRDYSHCYNVISGDYLIRVSRDNMCKK